MDRDDLLHQAKTKANAVWHLYAKLGGLMDGPMLEKMNKDLDGLLSALQGDIEELENENG